MSFADPAVLLGLLAVPVLVVLYLREQRRRTRAGEAFVAAPLRPSVAPRSPGRRRHVPMLAFLVATAVLLLAAARPQRSVAVPVRDGAVMLVDDVSSSMGATDLMPSRLGAAELAAERFLEKVPGSVRVGLVSFNDHAALLQAPTADRSAVRRALRTLRAGGHTAIGDAIARAVGLLATLRGAGGRRVPGAVLLLSDGTSTQGSDPLAAARHAAGEHIVVDTVALGTAHGVIHVGARTVPVPLDATQLARIAAASRGRAFTVGDRGRLSAVYAHLAAALGHRAARQELTAGFAGLGLGLVIVGGTLSVAWFGRLV